MRNICCIVSSWMVLLVSLLLGASVTCHDARGDDAATLSFSLRHRVETSPGSGRYHTLTRPETWPPGKTAVIVCDVWDYHHCLNAVRREEQMAPRLNEVVKRLRDRGVTVIHAPSDCMAAYQDHPARQRATNTPKAATLPNEIQKWCSRIPQEEKAVYPIDQSDGGEDDEATEHAEWSAKLVALGRNPKAPWKKQSDLIAIDADRDFISDKGEEVWSILDQKGISHVILAGVHTNMCVLGRPFGLRQMAKNGKHVVLMRDMTDTMYNPQRWPYVSHFTGTDLIVEHIEKFVCPTITSDQILGGQPFRYPLDKRPHVVFVVSEDEYKTEQTLPAFASKYLGKNFRVTFVFGGAEDSSVLPGAEAIDQADVLLVSVRRKTLPPEQLDRVRRHVAAGKPVVGIRTASHAFSARGAKTPDGRAAWPEFDAQVFGGHYTGHHGNEQQTLVRVKAGAEKQAILTGVATDEFTSAGSLYKTSPVNEKATVLLVGRIEGAAEEPVAWTFTRADGGRSFYTSLGHVKDFEGAALPRLLLNAIHWSAGQEVPKEVTATASREAYQRQWNPMPVPGTWVDGSRGVLKEFASGVAWYRCMVRLPEDWKRLEVVLGVRASAAGKAEAFLDGRPLRPAGQTRTSFPPGVERYLVPAEAITGDISVLAVRVASGTAPGGIETAFLATPRFEMPLSGTWHFRLGDDPSYATLPLPAIFAAATETIFERSPMP